MAPIETKKEHEYLPPDFIDKKFIKTLSKEKRKYWANRLKGLPGQGQVKLEEKVKPSGVKTSLDNDGNLIAHNRETRRRRPFVPNFFTKATNAIQKERLKNAKEQRRRTIAKARKARKASYSEVS